jgi:hypothetical protein
MDLLIWARSWLSAPGVMCTEFTLLQVDHFDKLRNQDIQRLRKLHDNINLNHLRSKGFEAGKPLS